MPDTFDALQQWLGIPPAHQPPHHYRLLGLKAFEEDAEKIRRAADARIAHVRKVATPPRVELARKVLTLLASAKVTLLDAARKAEYDTKLRAKLESLAAARSSAGEAKAAAASAIGKKDAAAASASRTASEAAAKSSARLVKAKPLAAKTAADAVAAAKSSLANPAVAPKKTAPPSQTQPIKSSVADTHPIDTDEPAAAAATPAPSSTPGKPATAGKRAAGGLSLVTALGLVVGVAGVVLLVGGGAVYLLTKGNGDRLAQNPPDVGATTGGDSSGSSGSGADNSGGSDSSGGTTIVIPPRPPGSSAGGNDTGSSSSSGTPGTDSTPGPGTSPPMPPDGPAPPENPPPVTPPGPEEPPKFNDPTTIDIPDDDPTPPVDLPAVPGTVDPSVGPGPGDSPPDEPGSSDTEPPPKSPIPAATAVEEIRPLIHEAFEIRPEDDSQRRASIARQLIEQAAKATDGTERYGMLDTARQLAVTALDLPLALQTVGQISEAFDAEKLILVAEVFESIKFEATQNDENNALMDAADQAIDDALAAENFDAAERINQVAIDTARKLRDRDLTRDVVERGKAIEAARGQYQKIVDALAAIQQNPEDKAACLLAGSYFCFQKDDWERGLPLLTRSGDPMLADLAARELSLPADADGQAALADAWYKSALKLPDSQPHKQQYVQRGIYWYRQCVEQLAGLSKAKAEKDLLAMTELAGKLAASAAQSGSGGARSVRKPRTELLPGIVAEYYKGRNFGTPLNARIESQVSVGWIPGNSIGFPKSEYSVRYSGWLVAPKAGRYRLSVWADDGVRVWLDGQLLINQWWTGGNNGGQVVLALDTNPHALRVEFFQGSGGQKLHFGWQPEGGTPVPDLPLDCFFHTRCPLDVPAGGKK